MPSSASYFLPLKCPLSFLEKHFRYSPYSADYTYPTSYYSIYGGTTTAQYHPIYGSGAGGMSMISSAAAAAAAFYPYLNFGEGSGGATTGYTSTHGYGFQYPHHLFQYSAATQHYDAAAAAGSPISLAPTTTTTTTPALQSGVTMALHATIPHR